jgi:hypothetical protein
MRMRKGVKVRKGSAIVVATMLAFVAAVPSALGAGESASKGRAKAVTDTHVTHNCTGTAVRPRRIVLECDSGTHFVKHLEWSNWAKKRARAHGHFRVDDCTSNCEEGISDKTKGRLTLLNRQWCSDEQVYVYSRARIRYREPVDGRRRVSVNLTCPSG